MTSTNYRWLSLAPWILLACGPSSDPDSTPDTSTTMPVDTTTSDDTTASDSGTTSETSPEDSSTTIPPAGSTTTDDWGQTCGCSTPDPLEPIPAACADVEVLPFEGTELLGWMPTETSIMAASHESSHCESMDPSSWHPYCTCVGIHQLQRYDFESPPELGEYTVMAWASSAMCRDECLQNEAGPGAMVSAGVVAETPTCLVVDIPDWSTRIYVDRQGCA